MKYFCYTMGDERDAIPPPAPADMAAMGEFVAEMMAKGVLLATGGMAPTSMAVRIRYEENEYTVTDGPFAEARELVGGWALIDVPSKDEALGIAKRFLKLAGGGESTIRPVFGPEDFAPPA